MNKNKKLSLAAQIFIGLFLGILAGFAFLAMGKAHGGIKGRDFQLTVSFIGMINSYITCWKLKGDSLTKKTIDSMVRQFMHGIFN